MDADRDMMMVNSCDFFCNCRGVNLPRIGV